MQAFVVGVNVVSCKLFSAIISEKQFTETKQKKAMTKAKALWNTTAMFVPLYVVCEEHTVFWMSWGFFLLVLNKHMETIKWLGFKKMLLGFDFIFMDDNDWFYFRHYLKM